MVKVRTKVQVSPSLKVCLIRTHDAEQCISLPESLAKLRSLPEQEKDGDAGAVLDMLLAVLPRRLSHSTSMAIVPRRVE